MPKQVRNFWLEADVEGRRVSGGPQAADGRFAQEIFIRDRGEVRKALTVTGYTDGDGKLSLVVRDGYGSVVHTLETER